MTVAIVGAGAAGLAAARALEAREIPFTCFEAREGIGGTWRYEASTGASSGYASLTSNTSRRNSAFRSFPMGRGPAFLHHTEMLRYLEAFTDHHGLREHIRFGTPVHRVRPAGGGWEVDGEPFRAVIVAAGYNNIPRIPQLPGSLDGPVLHARDYRTPAPFEGRDVVVMGMGCSATELACEISEVASRVTLAARSGVDVTSKRLGPVPLDWFDTRASSRLPFPVRRRAFRVLVRLATGDQVAAGLPPGPSRFADKPPAVCDRIVPLVRSGRIVVRPAVTELLGDRVRFADGDVAPAGGMLLATGYETGFPFLDPACESPTSRDSGLYRGIASPTRGLFFVGIVAALGALMPLMEAQAEWTAEVLAGRLSLPPDEVMRTSIDRDRRARRRAVDEHYGLWFDRVPYLRALERESRAARRRPGPPRRAAAATVG